MNFKFLTLSIENGAALVTLNRPEVYNALNDEITFELQDALQNINEDDSVRVVVLTGSGKAFCSGQDLKSVVGKSDFSYKDSVEKRYNPIVMAMRNMPKPIICRLNGIAAGAGCSLALACDMIIASEDAYLVQAFINIGLVPDSGSTYFMPRLVSATKAFELCTMGGKISAAEALLLGIVNKVVPNDQLDAATKGYVDYFAHAPTRTIGLIKQMLQKSGSSTVEEMLALEASTQEIAGHTDDHREGVRAFLEKRKPSFKGS